MAGSILPGDQEAGQAQVTPGGVPAQRRSVFREAMEKLPPAPEPRKSVFSRATEKLEADRRAAASTNARVFSDTNPDQAANDRRLARDLGAPEGVVASDRQFFVGLDAERRAGAALSDAPQTANWMADPENAKIAHDSVEQLGAAERLWNAFQAGGVQERMGRRQAFQAFGITTDYNDAAIIADKMQLNGLQRPSDSTVTEFFAPAAEMVGQIVQNQLGPGATYGRVVGAGLGFVAGSAVPAVGNAAGLVGGAAAGSFIGGIVDRMMTSIGSAYDQIKQTGADEWTARVFGISGGAVIGAIDFFADKFLIDKTSSLAKALGTDAFKQALQGRVTEKLSALVPNFVGGAAKVYGANIAVQEATELTQELIQVAAEETSKVFSSKDIAGITSDEFIDRMSDTAVKTFQAAAVLGVPGAVSRYRQDRQDVAQAEQAKEALVEVNRKIQEAPLSTREPAAAIDAVANVLPEIRMPADKLVEVLSALPQTERDVILREMDTDLDTLVAKAADVNDDVVVSSRGHAAIQVSTSFDKFVDHIRTDANGLTAFEAEEYKTSGLKELATRVEEEQAAAQEQAPSEGQAAQPATDQTDQKPTPQEVTDVAIASLRDAGFSDAEIARMSKANILALTEGAEALPKNLKLDGDGNLVLTAEQLIGLNGILQTAREVGLKRDEYVAYVAKVARAREVARNRLEDLRLRQERERLSSEYKDLYDVERQVAQAEVDNDPVYALYTSIGAERIDRRKVLELYQFAAEGQYTGYEDLRLKELLKDVEANILPMFPKTLNGDALFTPKGTKTKYETGLDPSVLAERFGFSDGFAAMEALRNMQDRTQRIQQIAERAMATKHPELLSSRRDIDLALEALHTDQQGRILAGEVNQMLIAQKQGKLRYSFVKAAAADAMLDRRLSESAPATFFNLFKRKAVEAGRAIRKGDTMLAMQKSYEKLIAFEMARYAYKVRDEVAQDRKFVSKFMRADLGRNAADNRVAADYFDAAKWLISKLGYSQDPGTIREKEATDLVQANYPDLYFRLVNVPRGSKEGLPPDIADFKLNDHREAHLAIRMLVGYGREASTLSVGENKRDLQQTVEELKAVAEQAKDVVGRSEARQNQDLSFPKATVKAAYGFFTPSNSLVEFTLRLLDNGKVAGKWFQTFFRPVQQAEFNSARIKERAILPHMEKLADVLPKTKGVFGKTIDNRKTMTPGGVGVELSSENRIMMALNAASPDGMKKLIDGMPEAYPTGTWTEDTIMAEVNRLSRAQAEWVQGMLNIFKRELRPLVEEQYRRETGKSPDIVRGQQLPLANGYTIEGGYFPLLYDYSLVTHKSEESREKEMNQRGLSVSTLQHQAVFSGMTKARTAYSAPLALDLSRATLILDKHVHYITHRQAIRDLNKLMRNKDVAGLINDKAGPERQIALRAWIDDLTVGGDAGAADRTQTRLKDAIEFVRQGVLVSAMTFSVSTGIAQTIGITSSINQLGRDATGKRSALVGGGYFMKGFARMVTGRGDAIKHMMGVSLVMRDRVSSIDAALGEAQRKAESKNDIRSRLAVTGFRVNAYIQMYTVDIATWMGAYDKALNEGRPVKEAAAYADSIVTTSQGSGMLASQTRFQRDTSPYARMVNAVMTYPSIYFNALGEAVADAKRQKGAGSKLWALGATFLLMSLIPTVMDAYRQRQVPEDEEEAGAGFWAIKLLGNILGAFGFVGNVASSAVQGFRPQAGIIASYAQAAADAAKGIMQIVEEGEITTESARKFVKPATILGRIPGGSQADRFIKALEQDSDDPLDYILGPPPTK